MTKDEEEARIKKERNDTTLSMTTQKTERISPPEPAAPRKSRFAPAAQEAPAVISPRDVIVHTFDEDRCPGSAERLNRSCTVGDVAEFAAAAAQIMTRRMSGRLRAGENGTRKQKVKIERENAVGEEGAGKMRMKKEYNL